jgi:uncharacterized protein (TIGR02145 family)
MRVLFLIFITLNTMFQLNAQWFPTEYTPPALIAYQAIARDGDGNSISNQEINVIFSIHHGSPDGNIEWQEYQTVTTNEFGLFNVQLGSNWSDLMTVNWGSGSKFLQVEMDLGNGYIDMGTQQMLSVPYALCANHANNGVPAGGQQGQVLTFCDGSVVWTNGGICPSVSSLSCSNATHEGTLTEGLYSPNATTVVGYTGGNGGFYGAENISSIGVEGLTASINSGTLATGDGTLTFTISGAPTGSGLAYFGFSIGGQSCFFSRTVAAFQPGIAHSCGAPNIHNPSLSYGTMTDQEGTEYKTITIGTQEWMAENLNTSTYVNGDALLTDLDGDAWFTTSSGAYSYHNYDSSVACPYGKLYNWYAVSDSRQLCPNEWHVATDEDFTILTDYLGGLSIAGGKMRTIGNSETGSGLWNAPNIDATNSSGFSAVPAGYRIIYSGTFYFGQDAQFWTSTLSNEDSNEAYLRILRYWNNVVVRGDYSKQGGFSVRCVRD